MGIGRTAVEDFVEAVGADFQPAQRLLHRFLEGAADGHHLADRFHLGGQAGIGLREFLEVEARHLGHDIVDARLERGRGAAAGDLVLQLVQGVADRQLGRDLGDGEAGGLGGQRRGTRYPRIHFDDDHPPVIGVDRELDVGAAGIDADLAQHRQRGVTQDLVFLVGQGLGRGNRDGIAGMHPHRVEIFDGADDDAVVGAIPHHLHLEFLPAQHRFFDQHFADRRQIEAAFEDFHQFLAVVGDAAAAAAQSEGRPEDGRKADLVVPGQRLFQVVGDHRAWSFQADFVHGLAEAVAVLGHVDGVGRSADHFHSVLLQHAVPDQVQRAIQRGLAAHGGQQGVGALAGDDVGNRPPMDRLDVHGIGHVGVGHDGGRIGVHQDDPVALLPQGFTGLRARIVELAGLTDHDGTGADDQNAV